MAGRKSSIVTAIISFVFFCDHIFEICGHNPPFSGVIAVPHAGNAAKKQTNARVCDDGDERAMAAIVWFNVGGRKFATTETTLRRGGDDNLLMKLHEYGKSGAIGIVRDSDGAVFVDRSPDAFAVVLEYLRTGSLFIPSGVVSKDSVLAELAFFGIHWEPREVALPTIDDVACGRVTFLTPHVLERFWRVQGSRWVRAHLLRLRNAIVLSVQASKPHDHCQFCSFCPPLGQGDSSPHDRPCSEAADWAASGDQQVSFTVPLAVLSSGMFGLFLRAAASVLSAEVGFVITHSHLYIPPLGVRGVATVCASLSVDLALECVPAGMAVEQNTTAIRQLLERTTSGDCFKVNETTPRYF
jgi:hypothetical protein